MELIFVILILVLNEWLLSVRKEKEQTTNLLLQIKQQREQFVDQQRLEIENESQMLKHLKEEKEKQRLIYDSYRKVVLDNLRENINYCIRLIDYTSILEKQEEINLDDIVQSSKYLEMIYEIGEQLRKQLDLLEMNHFQLQGSYYSAEYKQKNTPFQN